jgi:two-component system, NarL family, response regulator DevR
MADDPARLLLVENQTVLREALGVAISQEPDIEVVGLAGTIAEARARAARTPVDVAITDLHLPDGPGTDLIRDLRRRQPLVQVLVLTAVADRYDLAQALAEGAAGALLKTAPLAEIITAVRRLCAGQPVAEPGEILRSLNLIALRRAESQTARSILARLTPRERDMLTPLPRGRVTRRSRSASRLAARPCTRTWSICWGNSASSLASRRLSSPSSTGWSAWARSNPHKPKWEGPVLDPAATEASLQQSTPSTVGTRRLEGPGNCH